MEPNESIPLKEALTIATPVIKSLVDTFVTPKLQSLKKRFNLDYNKYHVPTEEHFSEYFHRAYKRFSIVNTLVFNNSQRVLKEIYLPLTLRLSSTRYNSKFKIIQFPDALFRQYEKILITDNAGMGKSTLMKKIFLDSIDDKKGIPIMIELRRLSKEKKILEEIQEQLNSLVKEFNNNLLLELLAEGGFIILLDGYDEIPLADKEVVTKDVQEFISKAGNNTYIMTSRPESSLASFGDFQEFKIEPLRKKEAFELLRKYDKQGAISTLLIKKLEESDLNNVSEFLTNPLLVSLLFTAFQHKQTVPFKKHVFYRQVYDANFESHDLTKGDSYTHNKYSNLGTDDFHRVLRHVGYFCLKKNQRIEFTKDEILSLIKDAKSFCVNLDFNESDFLKDLLSTVPLFSQDGIYYRWAHKSLQEYFAAQFIYSDSKESQSKILLQIYNSKSIDKFINILDLYYDIDPKIFRNILLYDFLLRYKQHYSSMFKVKSADISKDEYEARIELVFLMSPFFFLSKEGFSKGNHDRVDDMISEMGNLISGTLSSPNFDQNLYCLTKNDPKSSLFIILSQKIPQLFNFNERDKHPESKLNITHNIKEEYTPMFLTDKIDDCFNSKSNFSDVNKFVQYTRLFGFRIKTDVAFDLFKEIESQIEMEKSNDYFLDGL